MELNLHRLSKKTLSGKEFEASDVNRDGKVDIKDIMRINLYRLGKITTL